MLEGVGVVDPDDMSLVEGSRTTHLPFCSRDGPSLDDEGSIFVSSTLLVGSESCEIGMIPIGSPISAPQDVVGAETAPILGSGTVAVGSVGV